jgi:hypothetical protein
MSPQRLVTDGEAADDGLPPDDSGGYVNFRLRVFLYLNAFETPSVTGHGRGASHSGGYNSEIERILEVTQVPDAIYAHAGFDWPDPMINPSASRSVHLISQRKITTPRQGMVVRVTVSPSLHWAAKFLWYLYNTIFYGRNESSRPNRGCKRAR